MLIVSVLELSATWTERRGKFGAEILKSKNFPLCGHCAALGVGPAGKATRRKLSRQFALGEGSELSQKMRLHRNECLGWDARTITF